MPALKIEKKYIFVSFIIHSLVLLLLVWFSDFGSRLYIPVDAIYVDIVQQPKPVIKAVAKKEIDKIERKLDVKEKKIEKKDLMKNVKKEAKKKIVPPQKKAAVKKIVPPNPQKKLPHKEKNETRAPQEEKKYSTEEDFKKMMESIESISKEVENKRIAEKKRAIALRTSRELKGSIEDMRFRLYYDRIWFKIKESWILPDIPEVDESKLTAIVLIKIRKDGEIIERSFEKRSGNYIFDNSAMKAIIKANPLPPVPEGLADDILEVGVRFIPE
ncbi:MAG: TonB family protein [Candidatus Schekmanbacteria bacterium]|nr:MAG: TonB family protein [Candidatus Schekmanbacteria bacterium]